MKKSKRENGVELEKLINAAMLRSSEPYVCRPFMREPREDDVAIGDLSVPMRHLCNLAHEMKEKNDSAPDKTSKEHEKSVEMAEAVSAIFSAFILKFAIREKKFLCSRSCGIRVRTDWKIILIPKGSSCAKCEDSETAEVPSCKGARFLH